MDADCIIRITCAWPSLPLQVEFELDTDITDDEAVRLLGEDAGIDRSR